MINDIHMRPPASVSLSLLADSCQLPVGGFVVDVDVDRRWLGRKEKQVNEP